MCVCERVNRLWKGMGEIHILHLQIVQNLSLCLCFQNVEHVSLCVVCVCVCVNAQLIKMQLIWLMSPTIRRYKLIFIYGCLPITSLLFDAELHFSSALAMRKITFHSFSFSIELQHHQHQPLSNHSHIFAAMI